MKLTLCSKLCDKKGLTFIHPYDDKDVIAGQGTIGKEILNQIDSNIHAIFIAVSGSGLIVLPPILSTIALKSKSLVWNRKLRLYEASLSS